MENTRFEQYRLYLAEFEDLSRDGCRLYCPPGIRIRPKNLAQKMVRDTKATYMRDYGYDKEGGIVRIDFERVKLDN